MRKGADTIGQSDLGSLTRGLARREFLKQATVATGVVAAATVFLYAQPAAARSGNLQDAVEATSGDLHDLSYKAISRYARTIAKNSNDLTQDERNGLMPSFDSYLEGSNINLGFRVRSKINPSAERRTVIGDPTFGPKVYISTRSFNVGITSVVTDGETYDCATQSYNPISVDILNDPAKNHVLTNSVVYEDLKTLFTLRDKAELIGNGIPGEYTREVQQANPRSSFFKGKYPTLEHWLRADEHQVQLFLQRGGYLGDIQNPQCGENPAKPLHDVRQIYAGQIEGLGLTRGSGNLGKGFFANPWRSGI